MGNLLSTAKIHGIGIPFEPDEVDWSVGYMKGMGGGPSFQCLRPGDSR